MKRLLCLFALLFVAAIVLNAKSSSKGHAAKQAIPDHSQVALSGGNAGAAVLLDDGFLGRIPLTPSSAALTGPSAPAPRVLQMRTDTSASTIQLAQGGGPVPYPCSDTGCPPSPCDCSCFSLLSSYWWSCAFNYSPCCAPPPKNQGGPIPLPPAPDAHMSDPMQSLTPRLAQVSAKRCSSVPAELGDAAVVLSPDRTARLMDVLSKLVKPEAVAGLRVLFPKKGEPLVATPELRSKIKSYVLFNLSVPTKL